MKTIRTINEVSTIEEYKINKTLTNFSCISAHYQKVIKSEIKEIIPLSIQKIKYLRISAAQEVKDLYTENYKMLLWKINKT